MTLRAAPSRPLRRANLLAAATFALAAFSWSGISLAQAVSAPSKNAAAAAPVSPYHGEVVEDIIARVNDQVISSSDYARAEQELDSQATQRNMTPAELSDQKRQLLRDLVDNQLLLSKGKQLGITGEAETIRQLDELRKQNNLDSMEALEKAAEQQGVSFADFKASIQNRVITSQVIRDEVGRRINITTGDEQQYYDQHHDQFVTPEQEKISEILVPTADPDNESEVAKAQQQADALESELKAGKDFATLAKSSSSGSTAAQGGVLGEYKRGGGQLAKVLEDDTFALKTGEFTAPVRTKQGFVILKVDEHTPAGLQPFSQVQPQVEDAIGMEKMQPALRAYLTRLREEAYIEIKPGYVDSGASANETRPIFSAYQPPQPKKKKSAVARTRFSTARGRNSTQTARIQAPPPPTPAGVPSLADVPGGNSAAPAAMAAVSGAGGGTATATTPSPAPAATTAKSTQTASTQKPGKKEKVRFGQAPREALPAADTRTQDAGASSANGNAAEADTNIAQNGSPSGNATNARYENGDSATEEQATAKKVKTRFSQRPLETRAAKADRKAKAAADPYPSPAPDSQEVADKATQDTPLGLHGDTSKPKPKPKPTGKTRYSDEAGKKTDTTPPATGADANAPETPVGLAGQTTPVATQPYQEPSPQRPPASDSPVTTQSTPSGSGDPLGSPTPAPSGQSTPPQR